MIRQERRLRSTPLALRSIAILVFVFLAACSPADPMEEIEKLQAQGKLEATIEPLRQLIKENPGDARLLFIYGRTLSATGQGALAEWSLREAMKDPEWMVSAGLQLAADAARGFNFPAAIETATQVLEHAPDNIDALLIRASAYTHSRMYHEEALADVERILELDPDNVQVMEPQILALIGLERFDEVEAAMEELGRRIDAAEMGEGMSSWHCTTTAIFAWENGDTELSRERWNACLEAYPTDPELVVKALNFFDAEQDFQRSLEILEKAVELAPEMRALRVRLSSRLGAFGRLEEAEQVLLDATELERMRVRSAGWLDLAKFYQSQERYPEAADAVGQAVELVELMANPESALLLEYADALLIAGDYDKALEVADQMTYQPHQAMIRARVAQEQGDPAKALEHFDAGFLLWPDNPFARLYAARAAEALGDFDRAIEEYRYSIRISPGATDARIRVAQIHTAQRHYGEALQLLRIRVNEEPLAPEGELLSLRLWALVGRGWEIDRSLDVIRSGAPAYIGKAVAAAAQGVSDRAGPEAALAAIRREESFDPTQLIYAEALRAIVEYATASEKGIEAAAADLEAARNAHPDSAEIREIAAFFAERTGKPVEEVEAAYRAVLAIEPENGRALEGLARLAAAAGDAEAALAYYDRAAAAQPSEAAPAVEAARLEIQLGKKKEATARLEELIQEHSFDSDVALLLGRLQLEAGEANDRTLDLAKRAVRFGGEANAVELLVKVHEARGEPEAAQEVTERWEKFQARAQEAG